MGKKIACILTIMAFSWMVAAAEVLFPNEDQGGAGHSIEKNADPRSDSSPDGIDAKETEDTPGGVEVQKRNTGKKKKFPWLIVAGAVVVTGTLLYILLVANKKYTLSVSLGEGVEGTPQAGSQKVKRKKSVSYNYKSKSGYKDLLVRLDGEAIPASGTITMDKDHLLEVTAIQTAAVSVNSTPAGARIFMDGVKTDYVTPHVFYFGSTAAHDVLVGKCGYKDYMIRVGAVLGTEVKVNPVLETGHHEDFIVDAADCWKPLVPSDWQVSDGNYRMGSRVDYANYSLLDIPWNDSSFTVRTRLMRLYGNPNAADQILLTDSISELPLASGYLFCVYPTGFAIIIKLHHFNIADGGMSGSYTVIGLPETSPAMVPGLGSWNELRVVRNGSTYAFYINDTLFYSFSDSMYTPRYLLLKSNSQDQYTEVNWDYIYLDPGATTALPPGQPVTSAPVRGVKLDDYLKRFMR